MDPLISVLLPVYNGGAYLTGAIESILNQTFTDFEFIIINDGSTDNSLSLIQGLMKSDSRIRLVDRENKGLVASLNEGIAIAKGKYIARMDADDISLPTRLEVQAAFMEANPKVGVCGTGLEMFGADISTTIRSVSLTHKQILPRLLFSTTLAHPSVIIRKEVFSRFKLKYDANFKDIEDYKLWVELSQHCELHIIKDVLLRYRYHDESITRKADSRDQEKRFSLTKSIFSYYLEALELNNTEEENWLHFNLGLNARIKNSDLDLEAVNNYFNKILQANDRTGTFDRKELQKFLNRRFLIVVYYRLSNKKIDALSALFYKRSWLGLAEL